MKSADNKSPQKFLMFADQKVCVLRNANTFDTQVFPEKTVGLNQDVRNRKSLLKDRPFFQTNCDQRLSHLHQFENRFES